jgi:UDP-N-acetylglucosamine 1-carboxyvinyltransferase
MRASILLLAPFLARCGEVRIPFPGGCILGKRSAESHLVALQFLGAEVKEAGEFLHLTAPKGLTPGTVVLPEISVTATENALMAAAATEGKTIIRMAASEPHVQNLCHFLVSAGAKIEGIGTHTVTVEGSSQLHSGEIAVTSDYLEAGTFIIAAAVSNGDVVIQNVEEHHLDSFFQKLAEVGVNFSIDPEKKSVHVMPRKNSLLATKIQTGVFPAFPTDLKNF